MRYFSISFSQALAADDATAELATAAEVDFPGDTEISGGLLFSTAAAGSQGPDIGHLLSERWPQADLAGTSFEGVIGEGRSWRDEPAFGLLTWRGNDCEPTVFALEPGEQAAERVANAVLVAAKRKSLGPRDLVLLFPDAHALPPIETSLALVESLLGCPTLAGAGASGIDGAPPNTWVGAEKWEKGGLVGVLLPGETLIPPVSIQARTARATRVASNWFPVTSCRSRWIDRLGGVPALERLRLELGLSKREPIEPHLERLMIRLRRRPENDNSGSPGAHYATENDAHYDEERYIVGVDDRRGSFSMPTEVARGDWIAMAWPDADLARQGLREALDELEAAPCLLHFSCRARDAGLHGDADLEPAWVAAGAAGRPVLGTIAPFQLGPGLGSGAASRLLVHSSVLVGLATR